MIRPFCIHERRCILVLCFVAHVVVEARDNVNVMRRQGDESSAGAAAAYSTNTNAMRISTHGEIDPGRRGLFDSHSSNALNGAILEEQSTSTVHDAALLDLLRQEEDGQANGAYDTGCCSTDLVFLNRRDSKAVDSELMNGKQLSDGCCYQHNQRLYRCCPSFDFDRMCCRDASDYDVGSCYGHADWQLHKCARQGDVCDPNDARCKNYARALGTIMAGIPNANYGICYDPPQHGSDIYAHNAPAASPKWARSNVDGWGSQEY